MRLYLRQSGGVGGLRLEGEVDTATMPPELARRAEERLRPERLAAASGPPEPGAADQQQYTVEIVTGQGVQRFELQELSTDPEILEVVDDLMAELVRRKRRG